jgi:hypothetical protein
MILRCGDVSLVVIFLISIWEMSEHKAPDIATDPLPKRKRKRPGHSRRQFSGIIALQSKRRKVRGSAFEFAYSKMRMLCQSDNLSSNGVAIVAVSSDLSESKEVCTLRFINSISDQPFRVCRQTVLSSPATPIPSLLERSSERCGGYPLTFAWEELCSESTFTSIPQYCDYQRAPNIPAIRSMFEFELWYWSEVKKCETNPDYLEHCEDLWYGRLYDRLFYRSNYEFAHSRLSAWLAKQNFGRSAQAQAPFSRTKLRILWHKKEPGNWQGRTSGWSVSVYSGRTDSSPESTILFRYHQSSGRSPFLENVGSGYEPQTG